jgi:hypothetical protein
MNLNITLTDGTAGGNWSSSNTGLATIASGTGVVTGVAAGTPTITYTAANGCFKTYAVTVKPLPAPIVGNTAVCVLGNVIVTDPTTGGSGWASSNTGIATVTAGGGLVTGVAPGNANITYTLTTGCFTTKVVTVSPSATAGVVTGPATVSKAASLITPALYTDAAAPGGTWSTSTGIATIGSATGALVGVNAGAVTVSYKAPTGCYATLPITIITPREIGNTATEEATATFELYPNPTTGTFNINTPAAGTFSMYTLEGKAVEQYNVTAGTNILNMPKGLASGIYMCRFSGENGTSVMVRLVYNP